MRTTIDLPPELHRILASLASTQRKTVSQTPVARGTSKPPAQSKRTGMPLVRLQRVVTPEDVRAHEDEG